MVRCPEVPQAPEFPEPANPSAGLLEIVRAYILRNLGDKDGFEIVEYSGPEMKLVRANNFEPCQVMRGRYPAKNPDGVKVLSNDPFAIKDGRVIQSEHTALAVNMLGGNAGDCLTRIAAGRRDRAEQGQKLLRPHR